jgi:preprotein translocase subunit SecG
MTFVLDIVQVFVSVMLVFLILMHSGKDAGLSGFGLGGSGGGGGVGGGSSPFGGGSMVERNLNRWTVLFAVLFAANTIVLIKVG